MPRRGGKTFVHPGWGVLGAVTVLYKAAVALFVYPRGTSAEIKTQQQIFALYSFGFLPVMVMMYFAGMMGVMGVGQYVVMNSVFGGIALYNIAKL